MSPIRRYLFMGALGLSVLASTPAHAARVDFTIENLTHAITFRPFLVAAHRASAPVFKTGEAASAGVQVMAECGALEPLVSEMLAKGANVVANPVDEANPFVPPLGLLFPAGTQDGDPVVPFAAGLAGKVSGTLYTSRRNNHLSLVAMLLPTNDAFVGLDSFKLPRRGEVVLYLPAFDAGTEANDELAADDNPLDCVPDEPGYPIDPLGNDHTGGTGVTTLELNDRVHIHRNQLGDLDPAGGVSNLDASVHRWANPVIKLTLKISRHPHRRGHHDDDDSDSDD